MNDVAESRKETADRKMEVLSAKCKTGIGFWNVRTVYETGKLAQATAEMGRYNLHVSGISESRWTGSGRHKINTGETVLYSGREDDQHHEGEAIILKKGLEKCLMEWKPIDSRLLKVRLKGRHINTTIIQCYAPTNDCEEDDLALVSHTQQHMQEKTTRLSTCAQQVGLTISQKKTEVILLSVSKPRPV